MDSEPAEEVLGHLLLLKLLSPRPKGFRTLPFATQFPDMGREQVAHGTIVDEKGQPQPRTSFTYGVGTVLGVLCFLIVQDMAVTHVVLCRKSTC